ADPTYGHQTVNVADQEADSESLLHWMRKVIAVRRQHPAFGRGSLEFLRHRNPHVLAYLREHEAETILCLANFSRLAEPIGLDLGRFAGRVPVEILAGIPYPRLEAAAYRLTIEPHGFHWLDRKSTRLNSSHEWISY